MPEVNRKRPYRSAYVLGDLARVVEIAKRGDMSVYKLAEKYGIPKTTIYRHMLDGSGTTVGHPKVLSDHEESRLVHYLKNMSKLGLGLSAADLQRAVHDLVEGRASPFNNGVPGDKWLRLFFKRHADIALRSTQALSRARASGDNPATLSRYADLLASVLASKNYEARNIHNLDETMFASRPPKTIALKGTRTVTALAPPVLLHTSMLACVNADGSAPMPPMLIFTGKGVMSNWTNAESEYEGTAYAATDNGWMTRELFESWFSRFVAHVNEMRGSDADGRPLPVLLIFDGHDSHISLRVTEMAEAADITLVQLPAHTSHRLQPLDVSCFAVWHHELNKVVHARTINQPRDTMTRDEISTLIAEPFRKAVAPTIVANGFKASGIHPFDRARILGSSALSPANAVSKISPPPTVLQAIAHQPAVPALTSAPADLGTPATPRTSPRNSRAPASPTSPSITAAMVAMQDENRRLRDKVKALEGDLAAARELQAERVLRLPLSEVDPQQQQPRKKYRFATHGVDGQARILTTAGLEQARSMMEAAAAAKAAAKSTSKRVGRQKKAPSSASAVPTSIM